MKFGLTLGLFVVASSALAGDGLSRISEEKLSAVTKAVAQLQAERETLVRPGDYIDYRANLHVHSAFSHDSRGQIDDIVAQAKKAGTQVILFSEHPADHYDFFQDGHRGLKEGVLLIPGAEMRGFLCYPTQSLKGLDGGTNQEFTDLVCGRDGRLFICHLEERMDWELAGITGTEIYNTHADFKDETEMLKAMKDPLWFFKSANLFQRYPQAAFSALLDYPADYLRRYDELCQKAPHTGVAGNDSHQNVGLRLVWKEKNKVVVEDALKEPVIELKPDENPLVKALTLGKKEGDVLFSLQIDPYENSLRHVGTHLLMKEQTQDAVWDALANGRVYVAFDWMCNATGFDFSAVASSMRYELGSQISFVNGLAFQGQAPHAGHWRLVRNGAVVQETDGDRFQYNIKEPGVYRAEVWLDVAGERRPWILSNPIYVQPAAP